MSADVIKVFKEHLPAVRLVGKRYTEDDRGLDGSFAHKWQEWFENEWFCKLDELESSPDIDGSYLGCMSYCDDNLIYWIGKFLPADTVAPNGFEYADIPESDVAICFIHGTQPDIFKMHEECMIKMNEHGITEFRDDFAGGDKQWFWFFERYNDDRFNYPDLEGKIILDYGMYIK